MKVIRGVCARCEDGRASALFSPRAEEPGREAGPAAMSPGRLDGLYVVVVDAGGASARVRSIDPWGPNVPCLGAGAKQHGGPEPLPA